MKLSETIQRKFVECVNTSEWEVLSHDGWRTIKSSNKTIEYDVYLVYMASGIILECADDHILVTTDFEEIFAKDSIGRELISKYGSDVVIDVVKTDRVENMYDLSVDGDNLYFVDGILCHNTATLAVDLVHDLIFNSDYRIGFTSYTATNTQDVRERVGYIYESLPTWMKPPVLLYNQNLIKFSNRSSIQFQVTSAKTFRGKSLNRIVVDELGHVEEKVAEAFMTALLPSLTGGGTKSKTRLTIISTPAGTSGTFAQYWYDAVSGRNGFGYTLVEYEEIPNRGEQFEKDMLTKMSRNKFDQEYRCIMLSDKGTLINSRKIEAIQTKAPELSLGDLNLFTSNFNNRKIMIACDVSDGIGQDYHAMQIFDVDTLEQIGEYQNNIMSQTYYSKEIIKTIRYLFEQGAAEIYYTVENNGTGSGVIRLLENTDDPYLQRAMFVSDIDGKKSGVVMSKKSKEKACALFKDLVEMDKIKINSERLKVQLKFFVKSGNTFKAESGTNDDLVMACILMMLLMDILVNYEDSVYEAVSEIDSDLDDEDWGIVW